MSSNNNSNNDHRSLYTSLKEALVPHDQRRFSQERPHAAQDPTPRPRRESDESSTSFSAAEAHRDATGSGSAFLEHLTPGSQGRRRSSILDALSSRARRSSFGSVDEGDSRKEKGPEKYLKYI